MQLPNSKPRLTDWLRYSGACVILRLNPWHWRLMPTFYREANNEWPGPDEKTWRLTWLMVSIQIWIDNGRW